MCGRYDFDGGAPGLREIIAQINQKYGAGIAKTGEIAPADTAAVLVGRGGRPIPLPFIWGFPKWQGPGVIFNARAETAGEKPMFRRSVEMRRCAVPASGFYEWRQAGGRREKEKFLLRRPETPTLYMAGLWNTFTTADGSEYPAFVILTTASSRSVAAVHPRMPIILAPQEVGLWLMDSRFAGEVLTRPGAELIHTPV